MSQPSLRTEEFDWVLTVGDMKVLPALLHVHLSRAVSRYRELLEQNKTEGELDYVAWLSRNLVELIVWVEYCSKSVENAEDFFRDGFRDIADLQKKVGGLDATTLEELDKAAGFIGTSRPSHKYKHVSDAAEELGMKDAYAANCKILSKLVHPTAMSVLGSIRGTGLVVVRKQIVDLGMKLAEDALEKLDSSHLSEARRKYQRSMDAVLSKLPEDQRPY